MGDTEFFEVCWYYQPDCSTGRCQKTSKNKSPPSCAYIEWTPVPCTNPFNSSQETKNSWLGWMVEDLTARNSGPQPVHPILCIGEWQLKTGLLKKGRNDFCCYWIGLDWTLHYETRADMAALWRVRKILSFSSEKRNSVFRRAKYKSSCFLHEKWSKIISPLMKSASQS